MSEKVKRTLALCAAFSVIIIMILLTIGHSTSSFMHVIATEAAQDFSEDIYMSFDGYIFRNEEIICSDSGGLVEHIAPDGEKVGVGNVLARVYSGASTEDEEALAAQVAAITRQIELLRESKRSSGGTLSSFEGTLAALSKSYTEVQKALAEKNTDAISENTDDFLMYLNRFSMICGEIENEDELIERLEARKEQLLSVYNGEYTEVTAQNSGYFYYTIDGYENIFDYDKLDTLDYAALDAMISCAPSAASDNAIGKAVYGYNWSIAIPVTAQDAESFETGEAYTVVISGTKKYSLEMTLSGKSVGDGDGLCSVLVFECDTMPAGFDYRRVQHVEILTDTYTGYRVSSSALTELDGVTGVYILDGGVVRFRRVNIIYEGDGYCIVSVRDTSDENYRTYLNLNDIIITAGRNLYEGRIIG